MTPTPNQFSAASRHRGAIEARLDAVFGVYRSFETGSLRHGTGVRGHSDADYMFSLKNTRPSSDTALRRVREELQARFPTTRVRTARPAVVCEFADGLETVEVVPAYFASSRSYYIPAPGGDWLLSAPQEHLEYVNECDAKHPGRAKGLARLMKAWKYLNDVPISSFYLEMRAAQHINNQGVVIYLWDLCWLLESLAANELPAMNDPRNVSGRIYPCSSDAKRAEALSKVRTAASRARRALDADQSGDPGKAFQLLDLLFNGQFPGQW
jgi:hypothetical protein